jgi:uroporphyrinogen-III synthase
MTPAPEGVRLSAPPGGDLPCVLVTRPQPQADEWVHRLQALNQPALALPLLRIVPDDAHAAAAGDAWQAVSAGHFALVMFVSPNAVLQFFSHRPPGAAWPASTAAGATGPGTVAALQAQGLGAGAATGPVWAPAADSPQFDADTLWHQRLSAQPWAGRAVLIVRGTEGRDWLADTLRQAGASVHCLAAYRRAAPLWDAALQQRLARIAAAPQQHVWLFSSSEAIGHLGAFGSDGLLAGPAAALADTLQAALHAVPVLASHPRIARTARLAGFAAVDLVPPDPEAVAARLRQSPAVGH